MPNENSELRQVRKKHGLLLREVAELLNVVMSTVQRCEKGDSQKAEQLYALHLDLLFEKYQDKETIFEVLRELRGE